MLNHRRQGVLRAVGDGTGTIAEVARRLSLPLADADVTVRELVRERLLAATVPVGGSVPGDVAVTLTSQGRMLSLTGPDAPAELLASVAERLLGDGPGRDAPEDPDLLVSDAERDVASRTLAQAYAEGRFDRAELERRTGLALTAHDRGDLDVALDDLPVPVVPRQVSPTVRLITDTYRITRLVSTVGGVVVMLAFVAAFVATVVSATHG